MDTLRKLESAARLRFREAEELFAGRDKVGGLGAIYLYGYSVEIRLKVAYYRMIGLVPNSTVDSTLHRKPAEAAIRALPRMAYKYDVCSSNLLIHLGLRESYFR